MPATKDNFPQYDLTNRLLETIEALRSMVGAWRLSNLSSGMETLRLEGRVVSCAPIHVTEVPNVPFDHAKGEPVVCNERSAIVKVTSRAKCPPPP